MKEHSDHFFENVSASFRLLLALHFPQRRLDEDMEHSFTTRRPPSCLQSRHFQFYPPPPVTVIFGLFSFFVFLDYENQKTIYISDFIIIDTVSRSFVTHE